MKVLLVNGSPHKEGCTYTALTEVAKALECEGIGTDFFWIGSKPLSDCIACKTCATKHACVFDDKVNEFLDMAADYDGFIFGTPVHWGGATGAMTSFLDRAFYADFCGGRNNFYLKPAAAIMSARRAGTTATWDQMNKYFGLMQMPIITSRYWNMVHGARPEDVGKDEEGMQVMRILGKNMAWFLKCKEAGEKAGVPLPEQEQIHFTNFIRE
ncbi:flavodoxin family protein [Clostridium phoceensis]|uniref:flavodoxin family protein n=1 Tax=Clostridium phoceensis TaxID=1650661 RepID=UPI00067F4CC2|nr:flavodoxin family protein [Clostridium phoceensis]